MKGAVNWSASARVEVMVRSAAMKSARLKHNECQFPSLFFKMYAFLKKFHLSATIPTIPDQLFLPSFLP